MTAAEVLRAARERISDPERWTQEADARDASGRDLEDPTLGEACSWCAVGAVAAETGGYLSITNKVIELLDEVTPPGCRRDDDWGGRRPAVRFNDSHSHADVLRLFDKAIAKAEAA